MSTDYTDTLKRIKDAEEASNREVAEKKRDLDAELHDAEQAADESIELAKTKVELFVTMEVEQARKLSQQEADSLLASTTERAEDIAAKRLDKSEFRKIIDEILFSEFKEG